LWQVLWDAFKDDALLGFAHSHPGSGVPGPSYSDVTTFAAVEAALGKRLDWWITSSDHVVMLRWSGPDKISYRATIVTEAPSWAAELRRLSQQGQEP
jgi:proteasome lid subunit RPN8/RPN11